MFAKIRKVAILAPLLLLPGCVAAAGPLAEMLITGMVLPAAAAAGLAGASSVAVDAAGLRRSSTAVGQTDCARADRRIAEWRVARQTNPSALFRYNSADAVCPSVQQAFRDQGMRPPTGRTPVSTRR
jgi:hypothetical protein